MGIARIRAFQPLSALCDETCGDINAENGGAETKKTGLGRFFDKPEGLYLVVLAALYQTTE